MCAGASAGVSELRGEEEEEGAWTKQWGRGLFFVVCFHGRVCSGRGRRQQRVEEGRGERRVQRRQRVGEGPSLRDEV